jgi:D-amino-acid dehydrogenase
MSGERQPANTVIIGGGIIGSAIAAYLAEAGEPVIVIDRSGICEETSSGNAAAFAFSDVLPLAHKGMMRNLPKWLADPLGPLSIPPSYLPRLLPWLYRFWRAGASDKYEGAVTAQATLMRLAQAEWMALMQRSGTLTMLREDGSLELYESEAEFKASLTGWAVRDRFGIGYEHVAGARLAELQPGLSPRFIKGTFVPGWKTVSNPKDIGKVIWAYAESKGARLVQGAVVSASSPELSPERSLRSALRSRTGASSMPKGRLLRPAPGRTGLRARLAITSRLRPSAAITQHCRRPLSTSSGS